MPDLLPFLLASIAITLAPGPDNMQVLARGISQGRIAGVVAAAGFASGVLFHTTLAALGIAAALRAAPMAFDIIRYAGAAYLVWIGIQALRSPGMAQGETRPPQPLGRIFWQSVIGNVLNPKVTLFFLVFLPQFVQPQAQGSVVAQMLVLGVVFMVQAFVVFSAIGIGAGAVGNWFKRRPRAGVWLDRIAGTIFIALGLRVAFGK